MAKKQSRKKVVERTAGRVALDIPLTLQSIRLVDCKSDQAIFAGQKLTKLSITASCEGAEPMEQGDLWRLGYRVGAEILWACDADETEASSKLTASCRYEIIFLSERKPSKAQSQDLANIAVNCAWPYVRAFVSFLAKEMGHPPLILPLLRADREQGISFVKPANNGKAEDTAE